MNSKVKILNKKAKFEYYLHDNYVAGIVLSGSEIKSIRNNKVSIKESFCKFIENELFIINMNIQKYEFSNSEHYNPKRDRKLLLNKKELSKIKKIKDLLYYPTSLMFYSKAGQKLETYPLNAEFTPIFKAGDDKDNPISLLKMLEKKQLNSIRT